MEFKFSIDGATLEQLEKELMRDNTKLYKKIR